MKLELLYRDHYSLLMDPLPSQFNPVYSTCISLLSV